MKKKTYFDHMNDMFKGTNALWKSQKDGKAWDNVKKKTWRLQTPRGKVYKRFLDMQTREGMRLIKEANCEMAELAKQVRTKMELEVNERRRNS